ncbi:MAG: proteasome accessory factor [Patescibacteria group bacterium]|nr:proteasome accessory factor PafA2 family protein [Candidatus Saccharibacteria bacterium]MDQ5963192.1 proteasome accessory factor [Patescibacteria group bacterium]
MSGAGRNFFPITLGNEEETMLQSGCIGEAMGDPNRFVSSFERYIPDGLRHVPRGATQKFLQNGAKIYDGGALGSSGLSVNLERATPECVTPYQAATYIEANEVLVTKMLIAYVENRAKFGPPEQVRLQRRVIDSFGNSRGCHDNFGISYDPEAPSYKEEVAKDALLNLFLATRSFMTGAGYVSDNGYRFAQKTTTLEYINAYGYLSSAYRNADEESTGHRFEIRCNDIAISPWATQIRLGTSALFLALSETPVADALLQRVGPATEKSKQLRNYKKYDKVSVDDDGQLSMSKDVLRAVDVQRKILDAIYFELPKYVDIPEEYTRITEEAMWYCDDFGKVLHGHDTWGSLADRSDVAAKFHYIARAIARSREYGISRIPSDIFSQADDLRYDYKGIATDRDGKAHVTEGVGYRLRNKGAFRLPVKKADVEKAFFHPPQETRAADRGRMIRQGTVDEADWNKVRSSNDGTWWSLFGGPLQ